MGYLLIAVVFYTVAKFGFEVWSELFYARQADERDYGFGRSIMELEEKVTKLENRVTILEM